MNYIALAIPVFFLLIGIELLVSRMKKTNLYRFNDAITNISCGIGSQVIGVFLKTVTILVYVGIYEHFRQFEIASTPLTWLLLFIGVDFFYYWFHRLAHEVSILWGSHVVHHQSEEYNLSVALRQGWVQSAFSMVFYLPLAFIGFDPVLFVVINSFQTLYQFWIHTKTIGKLPAPLEFVFNTPSHHRVHHGVNPKYLDRNHGGTLIIFDRMFGTFQEEEEEVVYGITNHANSWNPLWLNIQYWYELFKEAGKPTKWSDRLKMLVKPPGWKPPELGGPEVVKEVTPASYHKYDTTIPMGLNYYILFHYLLILGGTTAFLFMAKDLTMWLSILVAALVIISIIDLGGLFEKRKWVWVLENVRVLLVSVGLPLLFAGHPLFGWMILASAVHLLVSTIWLARYRGLFYKAEIVAID